MNDELRRLYAGNDGENIILMGKDGTAHELELLAMIPVDNKDYAIVRPANFEELGFGDDEAVVFLVTPVGEDVAFELVTDDDVEDKVFSRYYELLQESEEA